MALRHNTRRPGPARSDRGVRAEGFRRLVQDDSVAFAEGVLGLSVMERRQFAAVFVQDISSIPHAQDAALAWLASEDDVEVAALLQASLLKAPKAYLQGETLWLVHGKGDALSVRESGVSYHPRAPSGLEQPAEMDLRDEAARRMWAHRGDLPQAASRFAGFFD